MRRARIALACALAVVAAGAALRAKVGLSFLPPHTVRESAAALEPALAARIDGALAGARIETEDDALAFALERTSDVLHFGLGHPTRLTFGVADREGNCIEYAHLFAAIFNRAAAARGLDARARVVHSGRARVFGHALPLRGFGDHDWALVSTPSGPRYVDPAFADAYLGWDIGGSVASPPP